MSNENDVFEARLKALLPEEYRECYEDVQPVSMGSAGLKYTSDGRVAWDEIWGSFCDLAMAGGPPHRGKLLEPATKTQIDQEPARYRQVVNELCRGVAMVTGLVAEPSLISGWIHIDAPNISMAGWLARAINMENVSAHCSGKVLNLPAGPHYRIEKEIKNVITSIAKTSHYWLDHTSTEQHHFIADLFEIMEEESPLIQPPFAPHDTRGPAFETLRDTIAKGIHTSTGLEASGREYHGWLGFDCKAVKPAIRMMRAVAVSNVISRREDNLVYIAINPQTDPTGDIAVKMVTRAYAYIGSPVQEPIETPAPTAK